MFFEAINPVVGGLATNFIYSILYTLSTTPAVHNVTIDGVDHAMTFKTQTSSGALYQYTTKLGVGHHSFTFTFSDTSGTITLPYNFATNHVQFPGPDVNPFALTNSSVTKVALPGQPVTYSTKYTSSTNTPPTLTEIDIDGVANTMVSSGGTNLQNGRDLYVYHHLTLRRRPLLPFPLRRWLRVRCGCLRRSDTAFDYAPDADPFFGQPNLGDSLNYLHISDDLHRSFR